MDKAGQGTGTDLHREDKTCCRSRVIMPNEMIRNNNLECPN